MCPIFHIICSFAHQTVPSSTATKEQYSKFLQSVRGTFLDCLKVHIWKIWSCGLTAHLLTSFPPPLLNISPTHILTTSPPLLLHSSPSPLLTSYTAPLLPYSAHSLHNTSPPQLLPSSTPPLITSSLHNPPYLLIFLSLHLLTFLPPHLPTTSPPHFHLLSSYPHHLLPSSQSRLYWGF